ncbi:Nucleotide exchange factor SIL1 [Colletotrichum orbiculare MAFF 240422]|uniref:Nucleotide exchange factor SIL1 n=1 Tax=Colletotrichum orbiculare (strain 104-T / ATCC 96160 / CBS 514.97 / LARS 414 / MAFF 240422) TaxID=1213857 RepID=N4VMM5_COLOR|nr:Nucleotide exchange factor SIL1 [Colletotrichum orbiculare MAFF 240422]
MASRSAHSASFLPFAIFMVLFGIFFIAPPIAASSYASVVATSPSAEVELICHTDNSAECYPKIFQPTKEFQIVRDDQQIPQGLHVRLNINTGLKEAKINDPSEQIPGLEGLPVDHSMVVVDPEDAPEEPQIPKGAPKYEAVGAVKQPQQASGPFYTNLDYIKKGAGGADLPLDEALEFMEDISHDMFYGLKITETLDTVKALFCLMTDPATPPPPSSGGVPRDQQAASILSSALQNNLAALEEVTKMWPGLMAASCPNGIPLRDSFYAPFVPAAGNASNGDAAVLRAANKAKMQVAAIRGLIKSPSIRDDFLANKGMDRLLEVLTVEPADTRWDAAQRKTGQLVLDTFLDETMGADVGVWPLFRASEADASKRLADRVSDGNWRDAVKAISERNKADKEHWSGDLLRRLEAHEKAQLTKLRKDL